MMSMGYAAQAVVLGLLIVAAGCGPAGPTASVGDKVEQRAAPKRITIAMMGDPPQIIEGYQSAHQILGYPELTDLVGRGLSILDQNGALAAQLAEQVPTVENGLWTLMPDGHMETTWQIRRDARWHDGTPV